MAKIIKNPRKEGKYLAHGDNGKTYPAEKVNKYIPGGVMFLAIPANVKILGYSRVAAKHNESAATLARVAAARAETSAKTVKKPAKPKKATKAKKENKK